MTALRETEGGAQDLAALGTKLALRVRVEAIRPRCGEIVGLHGAGIRVRMRDLVLGQVCVVERGAGMPDLLAEVVGLDAEGGVLTPFGATNGIRAGALVRPRGQALDVAVGRHRLGAVLDGLGRTQEGGPPAAVPSGQVVRRPLRGGAPPPMTRPLIETPIQTGIRAIDGMATLGRGQRIGVFGPPGTGKSTLMAAIARNTDADAIVIGLVGERGREVREFLERDLPAGMRDRTTVVASTSDRPPVERLYAAHTATALAEGLRDEGLDVLLMIDSMTRVARALREIGLAAGEAPTRRGYPASVYPALPEIIERAGTAERGSITALYTVLLEGDGEGDPIAEEVKSLTDGHVVLSQDLANAGHYPAIDTSRSLSRLMGAVAPRAAVRAAQEARALMAAYDDVKLLIDVGEYREGADPLADAAVLRVPKLLDSLRQAADERDPTLAATWAAIAEVVS